MMTPSPGLLLCLHGDTQMRQNYTITVLCGMVVQISEFYIELLLLVNNYTPLTFSSFFLSPTTNSRSVRLMFDLELSINKDETSAFPKEDDVLGPLDATDVAGHITIHYLAALHSQTKRPPNPITRDPAGSSVLFATLSGLRISASETRCNVPACKGRKEVCAPPWRVCDLQLAAHEHHSPHWRIRPQFRAAELSDC